MSKRLLFKLIGVIFVFAFLALCAWVMYDHGVIIPNAPTQGDFPVRGVDVSSYQGEIDWEVLAGNDIDFAFIKATEGSSFVDPYFAQNWDRAGKTKLKIGAYHFLSFDSPGKSQAENFIRNVPKLEGAFPPAIDVEFYGDKAVNKPSREAVQTILNDFIAITEAHYGQKPIIYTVYETYDLYIRNDYTEYPLWIRDVIWKPSFANTPWTFWQYSAKGRMPGYVGEEYFIDLNVFKGTPEDFAEMF